MEVEVEFASNSQTYFNKQIGHRCDESLFDIETGNGKTGKNIGDCCFARWQQCVMARFLQGIANSEWMLHKGL